MYRHCMATSIVVPLFVSFYFFFFFVCRFRPAFPNLGNPSNLAQATNENRPLEHKKKMKTKHICENNGPVRCVCRRRYSFFFLHSCSSTTSTFPSLIFFLLILALVIYSFAVWCVNMAKLYILPMCLRSKSFVFNLALLLIMYVVHQHQ